MNDIHLIGQAVKSDKVLDKIRQNFNIIQINRTHNASDIFAENKNSYILWIHFDTVLNQRFLPYIDKIRILASTTTGSTHIDRDLLRLIGSKYINLQQMQNQIQTISSTAEHAWALMMTYHHRIIQSSQDVENGNWNRQNHLRQKQIRNLKIGIVGFGRLGRITYNYGKAFGSQVYINEIDKDLITKYRDNTNYNFVDLVDLLNSSDYVFLHASISGEHNPIITREVLKKVKNPFVLVNTSRGCLVDEELILECSDRGLILGYLADVVSEEDISRDLDKSKIFNESKFNEKIILTPHIGGASKDAIEFCESLILDKILKRVQDLSY